MTFTAEEKAQRRREYKAYLKSDMWKAVRNAAIYRAGGKCEWCAGIKKLQVHHKKYPQVFGTEEPETLQVLCNICHGEAHGRPYILLRATKADKKARKDRLKAQRQVESAERKRKRVARSRRFTRPSETPSLKDRF